MEERIERAAHFLMPLPAREEMHNEKLGELAWDFHTAYKDVNGI